MNLYMLMSVIPTRINYFREKQTKQPIIRVYDKKNDVELDFDKGLFINQDNLLFDLRLLSGIWNEILPDKGQTIEEKHFEIAKFLGGNRNVYDVLTFINLLNKRIDINNSELEWLLEISQKENI